MGTIKASSYLLALCISWMQLHHVTAIKFFHSFFVIAIFLGSNSTCRFSRTQRQLISLIFPASSSFSASRPATFWSKQECICGSPQLYQDEARQIKVASNFLCSTTQGSTNNMRCRRTARNLNSMLWLHLSSPIYAAVWYRQQKILYWLSVVENL